MKAILQQPYEQLSGRNGALVNYSLGNNPTVRAFVTPENPQSAIQTSLRGYFTLASQAFNQLTDNERAQWASLAAYFQRTNSLGQTYQLSDKALYVMVNQYRQMDAQAISDTAPALVAAPAITSVTKLEVAAGALSVIFTHSVSAGFFMFEISDTLPGTQRQARDNEIYLASTTIGNNIVARGSSSQTVSFTAEELKFAIDVGQRRAVRITTLTTGYLRGQSMTQTLTTAAP